MVPPLFDEVVESGALIFMTMEANYLTQHAVPKMDSPVGLSGSMVFRTVDPKKYRKSVRLLKKSATKLCCCMLAGRCGLPFARRRRRRRQCKSNEKWPFMSHPSHK